MNEPSILARWILVDVVNDPTNDFFKHDREAECLRARHLVGLTFITAVVAVVVSVVVRVAWVVAPVPCVVAADLGSFPDALSIIILKSASDEDKCETEVSKRSYPAKVARPIFHKPHECARRTSMSTCEEGVGKG